MVPRASDRLSDVVSVSTAGGRLYFLLAGKMGSGIQINALGNVCGR